MSTLIEWRTSSGVIGRCDAKCHEATHPHCECICGGRNHGVGGEQAAINTREFGKEWVKKWEKEHPDQAGFITDAGKQSDLFR